MRRSLISLVASIALVVGIAGPAQAAVFFYQDLPGDPDLSFDLRARVKDGAVRYENAEVEDLDASLVWVKCKSEDFKTVYADRIQIEALFVQPDGDFRDKGDSWANAHYQIKGKFKTRGPNEGLATGWLRVWLGPSADQPLDCDSGKIYWNAHRTDEPE